MATGKSIELRSIRGGTIQTYLAPGQRFKPSMRDRKRESRALKRQRWLDRKMVA